MTRSFRRLQRLHEEKGIYLRKVDASGRITLPAALCRKYGWGPGTELRAELEGDALTILASEPVALPLESP